MDYKYQIHILRASFPNSVWERTFGRNSVSRGGGVRGRERAPTE